MLADKGCWTGIVRKHSGNFLGMRTTNSGCASSSLQDIVITEEPRLQCSYQASPSTHRTNSVPPSHDINDRLGATSFKGRYENLEENPFIEDFATWIAECFGNIFVSFFQ